MSVEKNQPQLLTIPMSHYCEKARWALERLGVDYAEVRMLQGFHYLKALPWAASPTVPILRIDGRTLKDSTDILHHLDGRATDRTRLFPADPAQRSEVEELERLFDEELGVYTRLYIYACYLPESLDAIIEIAAQGCPAWQPPAFKAFFPLIRRFMGWRLGGMQPERVARGLARVQEICADVEKRLADGRPYLTGDRFTAADLTYACMAAPLCLPPEYGIRLPTVAELPPAMRPEVIAFSTRPAGRFALRLFADHRHRPAA